MQTKTDIDINNKEEKADIKPVKYNLFLKNLKGFFLKKRKRKNKPSTEDENNLAEGNFFHVLKEMIIKSMKKEYVIKYFKKPYFLRAKIETRSITEYLLQNKKNKNTFFNIIEKYGISKLYNIIQVLNIEKYKKNDIIYQYKEPTTKFNIILDGKISFNLPYFHKKLISIKDFLDYFFYIKKNFPKTFDLIEKKNEYLFDELQKLKLNNYNPNIFSELNQEIKKEFYVEEYQKVSEKNIGEYFGDIGLVYNLSQNYNITAETDIDLLTMNRIDFMNLLRPIIENEILLKEFSKLKKYCYIFNSWSNFFLGQIMNYYIPIKLMKKEFLYNQQNFSDSFYIIQEGTFDAYCEISLSEFSKYKNYIIKNNKNIFDLINNEKEKNKLTIDKIIEHMNKMQEINIYPKDKKEIDKNMEYIKKKMLEQGEENDTKIINIKLNEDILSEKKRKIRIKLFTLKKNDIIGFIDSLELKNRFYTVECVSDIGELSKIRILDFIVFIKSNNGIDINKIYEYIQEKKNFVVDRVYKTLDRYLNNNKRIIRNVYSLAFSSIDKKKMKNYKEDSFAIKNMKNLNIDPTGDNNLINKIKKSINYKKKIYSLTKSENSKAKSFQRKNKKKGKANKNLFELNNINMKTSEDKSRFKLRLINRKEKIENKKIKTSGDVSLFSLSKSYSSKKNKIYKLKITDITNLNSDKEENKTPKKEKERINISPIVYNKKLELIKFKDSLNNNRKLLDKYITSFIGIYNTKREIRQIYEYNKDNKDNKKSKKEIRRFDRKKLVYSSYVKNRTKKERLISGFPSLVKDIIIKNEKSEKKDKKEKRKDFISLIRYLDKSKKNDIYKN